MRRGRPCRDPAKARAAAQGASVLLMVLIAAPNVRAGEGGAGRRPVAGPLPTRSRRMQEMPGYEMASVQGDSPRHFLPALRGALTLLTRST